MTLADFFRGFVSAAIAAGGAYLLHQTDSIFVAILAVIVIVRYTKRAFDYWGIE
jgi:hypothetical protein